MKLFEKKNSEIKSLNLVPLINIIFLLIIFFMLSGSIIKKEMFPITPPYFSKGKNVSENDIIILISKEGYVSIKNSIIDLKDISDAISENNKFSTKNLNVLIKIDKEAKSKSLISVMNILKKEGIKKVSIFTRER